MVIFLLSECYGNEFSVKLDKHGLSVSLSLVPSAF